MRRGLLFILWFLLAADLGAQNFSNKGMEFWVPYAGHIDNTSSRMALYISATENTTGEVQLDNKTIPFTVTANQTTTVQISPNTYNVYNIQSDGTGIGKGIRVIAKTPIVLYAHILNAARSGSTLVLPVNVLGKEYVSLNAVQTTTSGRSQITVVATENNTNIELNLIRASSGTPSRPANTPYQITLNKGDVYQVQSTQDLTGSTIKSISTNSSSCKPIAVFTGSTWTAFDCSGASGGDNLYQQVFPSNAWGRNYITAPFANRQADVYRIIVRDRATQVTLNGSLLNTSSLINNTYYEFKNSIPNVIAADQPILVVQYMTSQTCDTRNPANCSNSCPYPGDPEMITINPLEQTINNVSVVSARNDLTPPNTNIRVHYLNILMKTSDIGSLKIDNAAPKGNWVPIPNSIYSYLQEDVTVSTAINPSHNIKADFGFIALAYGMGNVESYGYNAGTNVKDLLAPIFQNPYGRLDFATTCVGNKFNFSVPFTYMPTTLTWDFGGSTILNPNTNIGPVTPVPDSTPVVNGKQLYYFSPANGPVPKDFIYTASGNDTIRLFATNPSPDGCNSSNAEYIIPVVINPAPRARFAVPATYCIGAPIPFSDVSSDLGTGEIVTGLWNWGDGTTDSLKNPLHTFNTEGTFNIRYRPISNFGCIGDTTIPLLIMGKPVALFTLKDSTCINKTLTFTDGSSITSGNMVKWFWSFGDGTSEILTTNTARTKSFTATGSYSVQLEVENGTGCKSTTFSSTIVIRPIPVPNFNLPIVCLPEGKARFFDSTTIADGTENFKYRWDFGDNAGIDSVKNPIYTYKSSGPFTVSLIATSPFGCVDSTRKTLSSFYPQAKAAFQVLTENCLRDSSFFTDQTDGKGSNIAKWRWSFGNTKTDTLQNPAHLYASTGTFNVQLFAITDKGCYSDTIVQPVTVNPLPTADFILMTPFCETRALSFVDQSVANAGTLSNWKWSFGDGDTKDANTGVIFQKTFAAWGNYNVELQVTSSKGCKSDTLKKVQKINPLPKVGFILPEICLADAAADLLDTTSLADNKLSGLTWKWRIDKGKLTNAQPVFVKDNVQNARVLVTKSDKYLTTLLVTSADGCTDSLSNELTVNGSTPKSSFTIINETGLCGNDSVRLINTSTVDFGNLSKLEIRWDFDNAPVTVVTDPSPEQIKTYSNRYIDFQAPATKTYKVKLTAFSGNASACQSSFTQTITLNRSPKVSFAIPRSICNDAAIQAISPAANTFESTPGIPVYAGTGIIDPVKGLFNPAVSGPGTFAIKYLHVSDKGCRDSAIRNITVWPSPIARWGVGSVACEKNLLTFTDSSLPRVGKIVTRNWIFGDGQTQTQLNDNNFTHTYAAAGNYTASLQVITDSGCVSSIIQQTIKINPLPIIAFQLPTVCLPDGKGTFINQSTIADKSEALFSYRWNFNDPNEPSGSTLQSPTHQYAALGPYPVQLTITSKDGCIDSLTKLMNTIYPQPAAKFETQPSEVCVGGTIQFIDKSVSVSAPVTQWFWDLGKGDNSVVQNPSKLFADSGNFTIRLYSKDGKGCVSDTSVATITVHPYPVLQLTHNVKVLEGGTIALKPVFYGTQLQFNWTPASYLDTATIAYPKSTPPDDITYQLNLTGIGGCSVSDTVFVKVLKSPLVPNVFSPNGDGINDTWRIQYLESYPGAIIEVFNRYGQKVFVSTGYDVEWDGYFNGTLLPVGTYYYIINPKNGRKTITGSVSIIR
jgi:gliding motility-associated-like protein